MTSYKYDAFISYSRSNFAFAQNVVLKLKELGLDIFFDDHSILYGQNIPLAIETALAKSLKIILVISSESLTSHWVSFERKLDWEEIYLKNQNKIIPLLIEACQLPKDLNKMRYIDFTDENLFDTSFQTLITALRSIEVYETGTLEISRTLSENKDFYIFLQRKLNFYFGLFSQESMVSLRLVIGELVSNAVQHSNSKASFEAKLCQNIIEIYVRDGGPGFELSKIIDEELAKIHGDSQVDSGRGLVLASRSCDAIDNYIENGIHIVRAIFFREKPFFQVDSYDDYLQHQGAQVDNSTTVVRYYSPSEGLIYLKVIGDVDCYSQKTLEHIFRNNADPRVSNYIFDLAKVSYIDSSGLGILVSTVNFYSNIISVFVGRQVRIAMVVNARGKQTIRLVRLEKFLNIFSSLEEAKSNIINAADE